MPRITERNIPARKVTPIIYALDRSGSMSREPIAALNYSVRDSHKMLMKLQEDNIDTQIRFGIIAFDSAPETVCELCDLEDFYFNDMEAGGMTDFGAVLRDLDQKLSRKGWLSTEAGFNTPILIFMSDGESTNPAWERDLKHLNENQWFSHSIRIAVAFGDANEQELAKITGSSEAVIRPENTDQLQRLLRILAVNSTLMAGQTHTTDSADETRAIVEKSKKDLEEETQDDPADDAAFTARW